MKRSLIPSSMLLVTSRLPLSRPRTLDLTSRGEPRTLGREPKTSSTMSPVDYAMGPALDQPLQAVEA